MNLIDDIPPIILLVSTLFTSTPTIYENPYQEPTIQEIVEERLGEDMVEVIECESNFTHTRDGEVLRSHTNDVGLTQINEKVWLETSKEMGYDIYSLAGNLAFAEHIISVQGKTAWVCYNKLYE